MAAQEEKPWRKILYEKQPYPDNFCGPEFLEGLKRNVTAETYDFWQAVQGSGIVTRQLCDVLIYVILFAFVVNEQLAWTRLLSCCVVTSAVGYVCLVCWSERTVSSRQLVVGHAKTLALVAAFSYGLSPVFRTLTETISTDTIYAMTSAMFLLSLVFCDYGVDVSLVSAPLSTNAALFGAVCLISRLPTAEHAFALLALALQLFALWPAVRARLLLRHAAVATPLTVAASGVVVAALSALSPPVALLFAVVVVFISFVCPFWLVRMQPLKSTIHGPWDEAVIND